MFVPIGSNSGESYQVQRSQRFRKSASAYASRTPGSAGNRKLTHFRDRIKRGELGTLQVIYSAGTSSIDRLYFDTSNRLCLDVLGTTRLVSTQVFRDPTAFTIDVGFQLDVANGTAAQRAKLMVDGVEVSAYSTDSRASITNTDTNWNNTVVHYLGRDNSGNYFDGYMAEPISVDGSLSSNYIATDTISGQLVASRPSATYGTNGFYLDFSDPTSLTTLMLDRSGNGNNWTANNISLTAGVTYDWMDDTPTNNYAVLNPLDAFSASFRLGEFYNANLSWRTLFASNPPQFAVCSVPWPTSGSYYCEVTIDSISLDGTWGYLGVDGELGVSWYERQVSGSGQISGSAGTVSAIQFGAGAVVQIACDCDSGKLWYGLDGTWATVSGTPDPAAGTGHAHVLNATRMIGLRGRHGYSYNGASFNFGQRPFAYTPPTGFKALHTGSLTNTTPIASGSFTGNLSADGPCIWCNGTPETLTINGNAVTWGTHADKLATGFKIRTASSSYNSSGTNTWTATFPSPSSQAAFKYQNAKGNP